MEHITDLSELISVAPESTVSRTVLREPGARVVLFGFDAGQELTEHTAAVPILLSVLDGRLQVSTQSGGPDQPDAPGAGPVELVPGGLVHIGARVPHAVTALEPTRMVLTMLDPRI